MRAFYQAGDGVPRGCRLVTLCETMMLVANGAWLAYSAFPAYDALSKPLAQHGDDGIQAL